MENVYKNDVALNIWKGGLSPELTIVGAENFDKSKLNFYSMQTGEKLNSLPFTNPVLD
jgi:hypothetical protein